jgi:hypothetical protein
MCQTWCIRRSHCARDQKHFCVCCSQSLTMYTFKKKKRAGSGMHGRPPDSATQAPNFSNDSSYDRHYHSFTYGHGHHAPQCPTLQSPSHPYQNNGNSAPCPTRQNNVPHEDTWMDTHRLTMNTNNSNLFNEWFLSDAETDPRTTWPLTSSPEPIQSQLPHCNPLQTGIPFPTLSSAPSSNVRPHELPRPRTANAAKTQSASSKSSSHISTPALTPPTPAGNYSTPGTSVDGAGDGEHAPFKIDQQGLPGQRFKTILPAPSEIRCSDPKDDLWEAFMDFPMDMPANFAGDSSHAHADGFNLPPTLPRQTFTNPEDEFLEPPTDELPWEPDPSTLLAQPASGAHKDIFDLNSGEESHIRNLSPYPPLIPSGRNDAAPSAEPSHLTHLAACPDPFLTAHPWELDVPNDYMNSNVCLDMAGNTDVSIQDIPLQSVEHPGASLVAGEGSRRDTSRDAELLALRESGLSYREIKQKHGFKEAESTLRGRCRTLLKPKEFRVRKPIWDNHSVSP